MERAVTLQRGAWRAESCIDFDAFADVELWAPTSDHMALAMRASASRVVEVAPWLAQQLAKLDGDVEKILLLPPGLPACGLQLLLEILYRGVIGDNSLHEGAAALAWLERFGVTSGSDHPWRLLARSPDELCPASKLVTEKVAIDYLLEPWAAAAYVSHFFKTCQAQAVFQNHEERVLALSVDRFATLLGRVPGLRRRMILCQTYREAHPQAGPDDDALLRVAVGPVDLQAMTLEHLLLALPLGLVPPQEGIALYQKLVASEVVEREKKIFTTPRPDEASRTYSSSSSEWAESVDSPGSALENELDGELTAMANPVPQARSVSLTHGEWRARTLIPMDAFGDIRLWLPSNAAKNEAVAYQLSASRLAAASPFFAHLLEIARDNHESDILLQASVASAKGVDLLLRLLYGIEADFTDMAALSDARAWLPYFQIEAGVQSPWHWLQDRYPDLLSTVLGKTALAPRAYDSLLGDAFDLERWAQAIELACRYGHGEGLLPRIAQLKPADLCTLVSRLDVQEQRVDLLAAYSKARVDAVFSVEEAAILRKAILHDSDTVTLSVAIDAGIVDCARFMKMVVRQSFCEEDADATSL